MAESIAHSIWMSRKVFDGLSCRLLRFILPHSDRAHLFHFFTIKSDPSLPRIDANLKCVWCTCHNIIITECSRAYGANSVGDASCRICAVSCSYQLILGSIPKDCSEYKFGLRDEKKKCRPISRQFAGFSNWSCLAMRMTIAHLLQAERFRL